MCRFGTPIAGLFVMRCGHPFAQRTCPLPVFTTLMLVAHHCLNSFTTGGQAGDGEKLAGSPEQLCAGRIADNFYVCEGYSIPRCLLYEMYIENCTQNAQTQVNPATFGKLVRLVFPDLGTRRLGTRGSARYHYDGIHIKKSSSFYAHYCYLLAEKKNHSGDGSSSEDAANYESNGYRKGTPLNCFQSGINLQTEKDKFGSPLPEFKRFSSWEQELGKTHSYKIVALLADEYCNYCQDVLQNLRNKELDRVEDLITSFWKSLQPETIMLMSLPDICQLFKCYDRQLFKEMESILLDDFLEDVSIQYLKSVRLFSKNVKLWLLTVLEDFPLLLRMSKIKEVTVFVKRLRRKTYLSNMAKVLLFFLNKMTRKTSARSWLFNPITSVLYILYQMYLFMARLQGGLHFSPLLCMSYLYIGPRCAGIKSTSHLLTLPQADRQGVGREEGNGWCVGSTPPICRPTKVSQNTSGNYYLSLHPAPTPPVQGKSELPLPKSGLSFNLLKTISAAK
ncbi:histone H1 [Platysternon megacephalum]|uniref:DNA-binding protein RFX8 n=1 Tax=Platysternon megacephalum TaxID=55544 RepID=A0A4D9E2K3_9SAUR|nr:histone H1 [Platysternon megacephalum]